MNLLNVLRDYGPFDLLHFTGHGNDGVLAFEDGRGGVLPVDPMRLQAMFAPLGQPPCRVALLNACHSESMAQAQALARQVDEATHEAFGLAAWVGEIGA